MQTCTRCSKLELRGPRTGFAILTQKPWRGALGAVVHADSESPDARGWQARRRRFSGGSGGRSPPRKT
eukprot:89952-Alexandrium_andersonii.AAC.1